MKLAQYDDSCFVCKNTPQVLTEEKPYLWLQPRFACLEHRGSTVLESGEPVETFLDRRKSKEYPLEGSGLNYLINPVSINGIKGWNEFAGGGRAVLEEIFPSRNYFEFYAQHSWESLDVLYALYEGRESFSDGIDLKKIAEYLNTELKWEYFDHLAARWNLVKKIQEALAIRGKIWFESPDEAVEIFRSVSSHKYELKQINETVSILLELGKSRFAYLTVEV